MPTDRDWLGYDPMSYKLGRAERDAEIRKWCETHNTEGWVDWLDLLARLDAAPREATKRDALNGALHALLGVPEPCEHGCTHVIVGGQWTALGLANVAARVALEVPR